MIECVPNFSEGRSPAVIERLTRSLKRIKGVILLDRHVDADHHRSVLTFAGTAEAVGQAAFSAVEAAKELISLVKHSGEHPRVGAADVVPFVPLHDSRIEECIQLANAVGERIGKELDVPVFLYEEASSRSHRKYLEQIRRGGLEGLTTRMQSDPQWIPDFGPSVPHPTAGVVVVGAREPLIAFNVLLDTPNISVAQDIAKTIRTSGGGLPSLKALGIYLAARGRVQVSMNLTNFRETSLQGAFEAVKREATQRGVNILESELVGLVPQEALERVDVASLQCANLGPDQVIENRLAQELWEGKSLSP